MPNHLYDIVIIANIIQDWFVKSQLIFCNASISLAIFYTCNPFINQGLNVKRIRHKWLVQRNHGQSWTETMIKSLVLNPSQWGGITPTKLNNQIGI